VNGKHPECKEKITRQPILSSKKGTSAGWLESTTVTCDTSRQPSPSCLGRKVTRHSKRFLHLGISEWSSKSSKLDRISAHPDSLSQIHLTKVKKNYGVPSQEMWVSFLNLVRYRCQGSEKENRGSEEKYRSLVADKSCHLCFCLMGWLESHNTWSISSGICQWLVEAMAKWQRTQTVCEKTKSKCLQGRMKGEPAISDWVINQSRSPSGYYKHLPRKWEHWSNVR